MLHARHTFSLSCPHEELSEDETSVHSLKQPMVGIPLVPTLISRHWYSQEYITDSLCDLPVAIPCPVF